MNNTYLITGGAGFIGSHFVEEILQSNSDCRIVILDNLSMGLASNIPDDNRVEFIRGDVSEHDVLENIFSNNSFNYIIHLAAIASVQDSISDPLGTHRVNFDSTLNILELARK